MVNVPLHPLSGGLPPQGLPPCHQGWHHFLPILAAAAGPEVVSGPWDKEPEAGLEPGNNLVKVWAVLACLKMPKIRFLKNGVKMN